MAAKVFTAAVAAALLLLLAAGGAAAQSATGCATSIIGLAPCLSYISGNATAPSSSCCSQLSSVVTSQPQCLCLVLNGGASQYGISLNQTQALTLPGACKVTTPPVSACSALAGAPSAAPDSPASKTTPATPAAPDGMKNTPATTAGTSDGVSIRASFSLVVVVAAAAAAAIA